MNIDFEMNDVVLAVRKIHKNKYVFNLGIISGESEYTIDEGYYAVVIDMRGFCALYKSEELFSVGKLYE